MLGLLVIIVVSWLLLHFSEKSNLEVLGMIPTPSRLCQFIIGFMVIIVIMLLVLYVETIILNIDWVLNPKNDSVILDALRYHLKSALTEDLVFRGAILFILIKRIGAKKAIWISAICFGIYHWFSYGIIGERIILLAYVFVITGFTGYVWAYTFCKTKSLMMGLGFHLGVNIVNACFFQSQPYGELIFQELSRLHVSDWNSLYLSLFKGLFPSVMTLVFVKQYVKFISHNTHNKTKKHRYNKIKI